MTSTDDGKPSSKRCRRCGIDQPLNNYYANPSGRQGKRPECIECTKAQRRAWYAVNRERETERVRQWALANPDKIAGRIEAARGSEAKKRSDRKSYLKRTYGMTLELYEQMLETQGGVCAVCGRPPGEISLHVDHDHETGRIRGLLCFRCNNALGDLGDSEDAFYAAAAYLGRDDASTAHAVARAKALIA